MTDFLLNFCKKYLLVFFLATGLTEANAQKEANVWHFGNGQCLDFNSGIPVQVAGSAMSTFEGSTSYCDTWGNLLFYSNGGGRVPLSGQDPGHIWNKNNGVMYDMQGLEGGGFSAAQSSVIIPAPGEPGVFYLFTVDEVEHYIDATPPILAAQPNGRGFRYFKVDMNLNGGLGAVVTADVLLYDYSLEGVCAIRHANKTDYWILMNYDTTGIGVYQVTSAGVSLSAVYPYPSSSGPIKATPNNEIPGAPCCNKVMCNAGLFDFDLNTGILSNQISLGGSYRAFEFSPNGAYLYVAVISNPVTGSTQLLQYDLLGAFLTGQPVSSTATVITPSFDGTYMQLAPDGKIYIPKYSSGVVTLGTINCPNTSTPSVTNNVFNYNDIFFSLPNYPSWIFYNSLDDYIDFGPDTVYLCPGDSLILNAGAGTAWSWGGQSASGVLVNNFSQFYTVTEPGVYSATVTGPCASGGSDQMVVLDGSNMSGTIITKSDSCSGNNIRFGISTNYPITDITWDFDDPGSGIANTSGQLSPRHIFSSTGTFTVSAIVRFQCTTDTLTDTITVSALTSTQLNISTCSAYTAPWGTTYNQSGIYSDTLTSVNGCDSIRILNLTIASVVSAPPVFASACSSYTAPWGAVYTQSGIYRDTIATASGCDSVISVNLTITGAIIAPPLSINACGSYTAPWGTTYTQSGTYGDTLTTASGCDSIISVNLTITGTIVAPPITATACSTYTAPWGTTYTQSGLFRDTLTAVNGCDSIVSVNLTITGAIVTPPITASACSSYTAPWGATYTQSGLFRDTLTAVNGCDSIVSVNLTITGAIVTPPITASACSSYTASWGTTYTQSGLFRDTLTTVNGCDSIISVNLTITGIPAINATTTADSCAEGVGMASVSTSGGTAPYAYAWSNGAAGSQQSNLNGGIYNVTVTDQNGCTSTTQVSVPLTSPPAVNVNLTSISLLQGDSIQLNASGALTYLWTPSTGLSCSACPNPVATPLQTTIYTVTGTAANGCQSEETVSIIVDIKCNELFVPTIFSPNSSGPDANEQLCVLSNCIAEMDFAIYDRWGKLIFQTSNPQQCWDGTKDGKEVTTGVYTYRLFVKQLNGIEVKKSGSITLTR